MNVRQLKETVCDECGIVYGEKVLTKLIDEPKIITTQNISTQTQESKAVAHLFVVCPHCLEKTRKTVVRNITVEDYENLIFWGIVE